MPLKPMKPRSQNDKTQNSLTNIWRNTTAATASTTPKNTTSAAVIPDRFVDLVALGGNPDAVAAIANSGPGNEAGASASSEVEIIMEGNPVDVNGRQNRPEEPPVVLQTGKKTPPQERETPPQTCAAELNALKRLSWSNQGLRRPKKPEKLSLKCDDLPVSFLNKWKQCFPWLTYHAATRTIFCTECTRAKKVNEFTRGHVKPGPLWLKHLLTRHHNLEIHDEAVHENQQAGSLVVVQQRMVAVVAAGYTSLFRNVLFVCQQEIAILKVYHLHKLLEINSAQLKAIEKLPAKHIAAAQLHQAFTTYTMMEAMEQVVVSELRANLRMASSIALFIDESTDITQTKILLMYVKYYNVSLHKLEFQLLDGIELIDLDAASITAKIIAYFRSIRVDPRKIAWFTSDGAAVMLGARGGVAQKLRENLGVNIQEYHCIAHREALALKDVYKQLPYFEHIDAQLRDLIHYLRGHKRQLEAREIASILDAEFALTGFGVIQTLLVELAQTSDVAKGLQDRMINTEFTLVLHHIADILALLGILNCNLQAKHLHPFDVQISVNSVKNSPRQLYITNGVQKGGFAARLLDPKTHNLKIDGDLGEAEAAVNPHITTFVHSIIDALDQRLNDNSDILKSCGIFNPAISLPVPLPANYGYNELKRLVNFFGDRLTVDFEALVAEWAVFYQETMSANNPMRPETAFHAMVKAITDDRLPQLAKVCSQIIIFDASNAEVERGFSLVNRLKTKLRNRLKVKTLIAQMHLRLNAASYTKFDYSAAFAAWNNSTIRGRYKVKQGTATAAGGNPLPARQLQAAKATPPAAVRSVAQATRPAAVRSIAQATPPAAVRSVAQATPPAAVPSADGVVATTAAPGDIHNPSTSANVVPPPEIGPSTSTATPTERDEVIDIDFDKIGECEMEEAASEFQNLIEQDDHDEDEF